MQKISQQRNLTAWILLGLVLLMAVYFRFPLLNTERVWPDEALYAWKAHQISQNPSNILSAEITAFHPPLFPALLAVYEKTFQNQNFLYVYRLFGLTVNVLGIILIFLLGKKLNNAFTGLFAALLLSCNYLYYSQTNLILIDVPLTISYIFLALALLHANKEIKTYNHILVGVVCLLMIGLKWSGLIGLLITSIYYLTAFKELSFKKRLKLLSIPFSINALLITVLSLSVIKPVTTALKGEIFIKDPAYYLSIFDKLSTHLYVVPFFILGLFLCVRMTLPHKALLFTWLFVVFIIMSLTPEKPPRYILPAVPAILLISSIGIEKTSRFILKNFSVNLKNIILSGFLFIFAFNQYNHAIPHIIFKNKTYTHFDKAGKWLKSSVTDDTLVLAGSRRAVRLFSDIPYIEQEGRLAELPKDIQALKSAIQQRNGPIILIIDRWEYTQPGWAYPPDEKKIQTLEKMGLVLQHTFPENTEQNPIIWIYQTP